MSNSLGLNREAVGNGSSTTVLVKSGRMSYNPIDIAITPMMINIITVFFSWVSEAP